MSIVGRLKNKSIAPITKRYSREISNYRARGRWHRRGSCRTHAHPVSYNSITRRFSKKKNNTRAFFLQNVFRCFKTPSVFVANSFVQHRKELFVPRSEFSWCGVQRKKKIIYPRTIALQAPSVSILFYWPVPTAHCSVTIPFVLSICAAYRRRRRENTSGPGGLHKATTGDGEKKKIIAARVRRERLRRFRMRSSSGVGLRCFQISSDKSAAYG